MASQEEDEPQNEGVLEGGDNDENEDDIERRFQMLSIVTKYSAMAEAEFTCRQALVCALVTLETLAHAKEVAGTSLEIIALKQCVRSGRDILHSLRTIGIMCSYARAVMPADEYKTVASASFSKYYAHKHVSLPRIIQQRQRILYSQMAKQTGQRLSIMSPNLSAEKEIEDVCDPDKDPRKIPHHPEGWYLNEFRVATQTWIKDIEPKWKRKMACSFGNTNFTSKWYKQSMMNLLLRELSMQ